MTDRKLLELAAKAAGIPSEEGVLVAYTEEGWHVWNPLADDGDALRLAVKLHIDLMFFPCRVKALAPGADGQREELKPDSYGAIRRAIVRAAAEIGKAMS